MKRLLSPKELADAIGVSESSLKRWADAGRLQVARTEGGHRRIPIAEAVRFIRDTGAVVVRPDLLGLVGVPAVNDARAASTLETKRLMPSAGAVPAIAPTAPAAERPICVGRRAGVARPRSAHVIGAGPIPACRS